MTTRWEYLRVSWQSRTNFATKAPGEKPTYESSYLITRPDVEQEELPGHMQWIKFLNELGAEGWELVSESIPQSVVFKKGTLGWYDVGAPVEKTWIFKRPRVGE